MEEPTEKVDPEALILTLPLTLPLTLILTLTLTRTLTPPLIGEGILPSPEITAMQPLAWLTSERPLRG